MWIAGTSGGPRCFRLSCPVGSTGGVKLLRATSARTGPWPATRLYMWTAHGSRFHLRAKSLPVPRRLVRNYDRRDTPRARPPATCRTRPGTRGRSCTASRRGDRKRPCRLAIAAPAGTQDTWVPAAAWMTRWSGSSHGEAALTAVRWRPRPACPGRRAGLAIAVCRANSSTPSVGLSTGRTGKCAALMAEESQVGSSSKR